MKIIKNEPLIKRNARIGQWTSLGALGVLGVGMYLSFTRQDLFAYSIGALILGFTMTQVGMYFSNRWGRSPRPDEQAGRRPEGTARRYNHLSLHGARAPLARRPDGDLGFAALPSTRHADI